MNYSIIKDKAPYIGLFSGKEKKRLKFKEDHTNRFAIGLFENAQEGGSNSLKIAALDIYADISSIENRIGLSRAEILNLAKGDGRALLNRIRECINEYGKIKEFVNDFFRQEVSLLPKQEIEEIINKIPETLMINPKLENSYLELKKLTSSVEAKPYLFALIFNLRETLGDAQYLSTYEEHFVDFFDKKLTFEELMEFIGKNILVLNPEIIKIKKDLTNKLKNETVTTEYLNVVFQNLQSLDKNKGFQNEITKIQENLFQKMKFQLLVNEKLGNVKNENIKKISTNLINKVNRSTKDIKIHLDKFFKELYGLEPKLFSNDIKNNSRSVIDKNKIIVHKNNRFLNLIFQKINYVKELTYERFYHFKLKLEVDKDHSYTIKEFIDNLSFQVKSLSAYKMNQDFQVEGQDFQVEVDAILLDLSNLLKNEVTLNEFKNIVNKLHVVLKKCNIII